MAQLEGKTIIVTGSGSGIGRASAMIFAAAKANVVVADRHEAGAAETVSRIHEAGGSAVYLRVDLSKETEVEKMVAFTVDKFGRLDGAFNNAGIEQHAKTTHELSETEWRKVLDINLTAVFFCMKHEIAAMLKTGGGAIVNTSSVLGHVGIPFAAEYVAAKHGVIGVTRTAAVEYGRQGIRVNAIMPGCILTPMVEEKLLSDPAFESLMEGIVSRHAIGRLGKPEEIGNAAKFLLSDDASFVTGLAMAVDGGYTAW